MGNKPKTILERLSHAYQMGRGVRMSPADVIVLQDTMSKMLSTKPEPEPGPLGVGTTEDLRATVDSAPPQVSKYEID
jgi:hypothetical protein